MPIAINMFCQGFCHGLVDIINLSAFNLSWHTGIWSLSVYGEARVIILTWLMPYWRHSLVRGISTKLKTESTVTWVMGSVTIHWHNTQPTVALCTTIMTILVLESFISGHQHDKIIILVKCLFNLIIVGIILRLSLNIKWKNISNISSTEWLPVDGNYADITRGFIFTP